MKVRDGVRVKDIILFFLSSIAIFLMVTNRYEYHYSNQMAIPKCHEPHERKKEIFIATKEETVAAPRRSKTSER